MKNKILPVIFGVVLATVLSVPARADGHTLGLETTVTIARSGQATVKHTASSSNASESPLPSAAEFSVSGTDIKNVSAKDNKGNDLETTFNQNNGQIEVAIPSSRRNSNKNWKFTLTYKSKLLESFASVSAAQAAAVQTNLDVTRHTMDIVADVGLGFASVKGPKPASTDLSVGQQTLTFRNNKGQIESSPILLFGEKTFADMKFEAVLKNDSFWWQEVSLTLPPDTNQQHVILNSIEPRPNNVRLDRDGNILASYRLGPRQSVSVAAELKIELSVFNYKFEDTGSVESIDELLVERYTRQTKNWQPVALDIEADGSDANQLIRQVFNQVVERAKEDTQDQQLQLAARSGALKYSDWLVGELRSRGIPARAVIGLLSTDGQRLLAEPKSHAWAEVYVPGTGWVTLDPWLSVRTGEYANADPLHIAIGLWGIEEDRPPVVLDGTTINYSDEPAEPGNPSDGVTLSATKHVWLPFVSTLSVEASWPTGGIIDDTAIQVDGSEVALGSIAPQQTSRLRFARLGGAATSSETVKVGQLGDDGFILWQEAQSDTSYVPLAAISAAVIAAGLIIWRKRRQARQFKAGVDTSTPDTTLSAPPPDMDIEEHEESGPDGNHSVEPAIPPAPSPHSPPDVSAPARLVRQRQPARPDSHRNATIKRDEYRLRSRQPRRLIQ